MNRYRTIIKAFVLCAVLTIIWPFKAFATVEVGITPPSEETAIETATERDLEALRCVIYWESGECACDDEVLKAITETVLNRVASTEFPNTIYDVIHDRKYGRQFYVADAPHDYDDRINAVIEYVRQNGRTVLPAASYMFFATKKQSLGKNHVWVGELKNGKPRKGKGMYFCRGK